MTVQELRDLLEGVDGDVEVKMATQPSYPFTHDVAGLNISNPKQGRIDELEADLSGGDLTDEERSSVDKELSELKEAPMVVYVLEGGNQEYASRDLWSI